MSIEKELDSRQQRGRAIVIVYPIVVLLISVVINVIAFDIGSGTVALPTHGCVSAFAVAAILLCINHSWLMTATELKRVRFNMHSTPEEWLASGTSIEHISKVGIAELARAHNAHRNTTENTVFFALLSVPFIFVGPQPVVAMVWLVGYSLARLGYTYGYLTGRDSVRSIFMTLSLVTMYGVGSYIFMRLFL